MPGIADLLKQLLARVGSLFQRTETTQGGVEEADPVQADAFRTLNASIDLANQSAIGLATGAGVGEGGAMTNGFYSDEHPF